MLSARRLQRRLNTGILLETLPVAAWAVASAFAATRILWPAATAWVTPAALAAAAAWALLRMRRRAWSEAQAAVVLDRLAGAGGLLLTLREAPDPRWAPQLEERLRAARAPAIGWQKPLVMALAAGAFALAAALVPHPVAAAAQVQVAAQNAVEQLAQREEVLAQEMPVPEQLRQELERLREEAAQGTFDATDWEAADNVGEALEGQAKARAEALDRAAKQAERLAEALARKNDEEAQTREREALEQALSELGAQGGQQAQSGQQQQQGSGQQQQQGQQSGGTPQTRADAQALRDALEQRKQQLSKQFPNAAGQGSQGQGQGQGQQQGQGQGQGNHTPGDGQQSGNGDSKQIGQGGPAHGQAPDTPLRFGDETKFQENRLQFAPLPQGQGGDDSGTPWGLSRRAPKKTTDAALGAPQGEAPGGDDAPGGRTGLVPPRHRDLVRRYFDLSPRPPARTP